MPASATSGLAGDFRHGLISINFGISRFTTNGKGTASAVPFDANNVRALAPAGLLHVPAALPLTSPAHGQPVNLNRRNAHAHRNRLSIFPARANAFIQLQIIAHH
jgi:hypothetical protein